MSIATEQCAGLSRMLPLLRSIVTEVKERTCAITHLEGSLAALAGTRRIHQREMYDLEARLACQRQALRSVDKELARLGWSFDADDSSRLRFHGGHGQPDLSVRLDQTCFRQPQDRV